MEIDLIDEDLATFSFERNLKVSIRGKTNNQYQVIWKKRKNSEEEYEHIYTLGIAPGMWGQCSFDDEISEWLVEIWLSDKKINSFENKLQDKNVFILANPSSKKVGKESYFFENLMKYCINEVEKHKCFIFVFFERTEKFDFSHPRIQPVRINQDIEDFIYCLEKEF